MYVCSLPFMGARACLFACLGRDFLELSKTKEAHVGVLHDFNFGGVVPSVLNFSDMRTLEHELAQTTLSNTTTNCLGEGTVEQ